MDTRKRNGLLAITFTLALCGASGGCGLQPEEEIGKVTWSDGIGARDLEEGDLETGYSESGENRYVINLYPAEFLGEDVVLSYGEDYYSYEKYEGKTTEYKWREQDEVIDTTKYRTYIKCFDIAEYIYRDYETGEVVKKTDLKSVFNSNKFSYWQIQVVEGPITYQGRRFLKTEGIKIPEEPEDIKTAENKTLLIDEETGEVLERPEDWNYWAKYDTEEIKEAKIQAAWKTAAAASYIYHINEEKEMDVIVDAENYDYEKGKVFCVISCTGASLPEENGKLYGEFPALKKYQGLEEKEIDLIFFDIPSNEEIVEMFVEEGQEISYEGNRLGKLSCLDGKEHEINSIDEYYLYRYGGHFADGPTEAFRDI